MNSENDTYINGHNNVTLEELLKDDTPTRESIANVEENDDDEEYYECLNAFVIGDPEKCLETMLNYGMLTSNKLITANRELDLFLKALDGLQDISRLNRFLKETIRNILASDTCELLLSRFCSLRANEISTLDLFFKCCSKLYSTDTIEYKRAIDVLELNAKTTIIKISESAQGGIAGDNVFPLYHLTETYIFKIKIGLQQKIPSITLYSKLCEVAPSLPILLKETNDIHCGKPVERLILDQLRPKQPSKAGHTKKTIQEQNSNAYHHYSQGSTVSKPTDVQSTETPQDSRDQHLQNLHINQLSSILNYLQGWSKQFQKLHISSQALFILILLLLSRKSLRKITRLPGYMRRIYLRIEPQLSNFLKLLSSI